MKKYGLIGMPLGHSFSAGYFAEKFAKEGIDARYDNYEMPSVEGLRALIEGDAELCGLNVTIPHKQAVIPLLDELSPAARSIGAVNVIKIVRRDGAVHLKGYNSDVIGFTESIRPLIKPCHTRALVLGTGGASKAVVAGLLSLGIEPTYVSRRQQTPQVEGIAGCITYDELLADNDHSNDEHSNDDHPNDDHSNDDHSYNIIKEHTVIVNCSPVGMHPNVDAAPALPYHLLTSDHLLYDLVYNPLDTRFMQLGREHGAVVKNGLEMLHRQAIAAWEMWTR